MPAATGGVAATRPRAGTGHAQLVRSAAKQLFAGRTELRERGAVRIQDLPAAANQQQRLGRLLEQRPIAFLRGDQSLAQAEVRQRDAGDASDGIECPWVHAKTLDRT